VLYLATVHADAIFLPLNTACTLNELEYFITDAEPPLVVSDPSKRDGVAKIAARVSAMVDTLDPSGKGSLADSAAKQSLEFKTVARDRARDLRGRPAAQRHGQGADENLADDLRRSLPKTIRRRRNFRSVTLFQIYGWNNRAVSPLRRSFR
jgi:acyl-CoA synthetase (AMP-forming)/AMP-acid ligase II